MSAGNMPLTYLTLNNEIEDKKSDMNKLASKYR